MPDYSDLNPANLKPGLTTPDGANLKPGLVTSAYTGGTPSAANQIKPSLRNADGSLKSGLLLGSSLKPSLLNGAVPDPAFVSTWDTTKLSTGSSNATSIKIPTVSGGTYDCVVDWGDGTFDTITTWNDPKWTHDYGVGNGELKTVRMTGTFKGFSCIGGDSTDKLKILRIESWGRSGNGLVNGNRFDGCSNLASIAKFDLPGSDVAYMFRNCSSLTSLDVSGWNVSSVTNMAYMFNYCTSLTSLDVSGWDVSSVTNMAEMFTHANMTNEKYSDTLENWSLLPVQPNVNFTAGPMKYLARAATARGILTGAPNNWTVTDGGPA